MITTELLKEKILEVAITGNLIKNNDLLEKCDIKSIDYKPFDIPNNWVWSKMNYISTYKNGFAFNSSMMNNESEIGYPVIKSANIGKKEVIINSKTDYVVNPSEKMLDCVINKDDILMVLSSQSSNVEPLGISAIYKFETPALLNQRVLKIICNEKLNPNYVLYAINSRWFHTKLSNKAAGLAQANLKLEHVLSMEIPIPPLEEQKRIVSKIDELFKLIDKKEKNEQEKTKLKEVLKEKILNSAIHGTLIKNDNSLQAIEIGKELSDIPFEIPSNWIWVYLKNISDYGNNKKKNGKEIKDDEWILELEDIEKDTGRIIKKVMQKERKAVSDKNIFKKNDVLYGKLRPYLNKCVIVHECGYCSTEIEPITLIDSVMPKYLHIVLTSKYFLNYVNTCSYGAKMPRLGTKDGQNAMIPLPPFEEQKRIVEKTESLFELIEQL